MRRAYLATILVILGGCSAAVRAPLEVYWLANEGVLLRSADQAVLIDAFVPEPYSIYTALPAPVAADMLAGAAPFDAVDLALVSHVHRDHFQPSFAARYLAANPDVKLVSSPQVVELLEGNHERLYPGPGESMRVRHGAIEVQLLNLSHGSGPVAAIQNLGHVVELGGYRVAHVGDAEENDANFARYEQAFENLDVALIPYWYFVSDRGRALVNRRLQAPLQIAVHIPRSGEDDDNLAAARAAGAIVPDNAPARWVVGGR